MYLYSIYKYFQEFIVPVESTSLKIKIARNCSQFETLPNATAQALSSCCPTNCGASGPLPNHHGSLGVGLERERAGIRGWSGD
jgi:hypothetical protein